MDTEAMALKKKKQKKPNRLLTGQIFVAGGECYLTWLELTEYLKTDSRMNSSL